jgi:hypothetical protein
VQVSKAPTPNSIIWLGCSKVTVVRASQRLKQRSPILVIEDGMQIDWREVHLKKACWVRSCRREPGSNLAWDKAVHSEKDEESIASTEEGK